MKKTKGATTYIILLSTSQLLLKMICKTSMFKMCTNLMLNFVTTVKCVLAITIVHCRAYSILWHCSTESASSYDHHPKTPALCSTIQDTFYLLYS